MRQGEMKYVWGACEFKESQFELIVLDCSSLYSHREHDPPLAELMRSNFNIYRVSSLSIQTPDF